MWMMVVVVVEMMKGERFSAEEEEEEVHAAYQFFDDTQNCGCAEVATSSFAAINIHLQHAFCEHTLPILLQSVGLGWAPPRFDGGLALVCFTCCVRFGHIQSQHFHVFEDIFPINIGSQLLHIVPGLFSIGHDFARKSGSVL
jgi:hypothetical protein